MSTTDLIPSALAVTVPKRIQNGTTRSTMATLTIKGMPDELYERLKDSAGAHRRSINGEVIARLEQALGSPRLARAELLARARAIRERMGPAPITEAWLTETKKLGRP